MTSLTPFTSRYPEIFDDFRREMDTMLNRFLSPGEAEERRLPLRPLCNVAETENQYEVTLDVPGMKPDDFNIELKQNELWISGERKEESEEKGRTWHRIERRSGWFQRVVPLGHDADPNQVEAEYKDGVLRVSINKTEEARPRKIEVKT